MNYPYLRAAVSLIGGVFFVVSAARGDITTGLIGEWELNDGPGSSTAADLSPNDFTGALTDFSDATYTSMWTPNGKFGEGLLFNANGDTNDNVSIPNETSFNFNTGREMTIAAWVNCSVPGNAQSNGAAIVCKGANGQEQYSLYISNGVFASIVRNTAGTGVQLINSTVTPASNTWYHLVMVWGDTPQINNIYIDGQFNSTKTGSGFTTSELTTADPLTIGAKEPGTVNVNIPFQGIINDVRLYNRVLTTTDILQLYTNGATAANVPAISLQPRGVSGYLGDSPVFSVAINGSTTLLPVAYQWQLNSTNIAGATASSLTVSNAQATNAGTYTVVITNSEGMTVSSNAVLALQSLPAADTNTGLVGYWKFDDGSGSSTAADSSGNGNTGVLAGFNDPTFTTMWTNGLFGDALDFNIDATNVVAVPNVGQPAPATLDFSTSPIFSLSAWAMGGSTQTGGAAIIAKGTGGGGEQYTLDIEGGNYRFFVRDTNGIVYTAQTPVGPSGSWQHVAAVLNAPNGIMNCYVNGQLEASAVAPFSILTNSHEVSIGNRQLAAAAYGLAFSGTLDDVRIYNRALTSADVFALYSSKPAPLTINWSATNYDVVTGSELQLAPAITGGVPPLSYQWQQNGTNVNGATSYPLIISNVPASAGGTYDLVVSDSGIVPTVTSSTVTVTMQPYLTFNTNGVSWANKGSAQTSAIWLGTNVAQLTALGSDQSNSVFYLFPQQIGQFEATFNYQMAAIPGGTTGPGDGLTFCVQNDPRGVSAIGENATGLGVGNILGTGGNTAISPSVEFEINVNSGSASTGVSWDTDGALGPSLATAPLALDLGTAGAGDIINVQIAYLDGVAAVSLTDTNAGTQYSTSINLDIPSVLSSSVGYVGFTAATGSAYGEQQISDFTYKNVVSPLFTQEPISTTNINSGGALTVSAAAIGSAPISYQWLDENKNPVPGATNATLSIADLSTNNTFTLEVYNPYGTNFSSQVSVTAISGSPQLVQDITSTTAVVGSTVVLSAVFQGTLPMTNQWQSNGVTLVNGGRVSGANTATLTINNVQLSDSATYQLFATNISGTGQTSGAALTVAPTLGFNDTGSGWSAQPPYSWVYFEGDQTLQLTDGALNEAGSAFAQFPVYVGAFQAAFTYQLANGTANGTTFCIQNDPRGAAAFGTNADYLGVGGPAAITPSVEVELNINSANGIGGVGISVNTNGSIGPTISTAPLALNSGDPINVVVKYSGGTLAISLSDPTAATQYALSTNINIAAILGTNFGYVGFTASDGAGGSTAQQFVTDFSYISLLSPAATVSGGNLTLSWPGASGAYALQQTPVLGPSAHWTTISVTPTSVNGQSEVTIPAPTTPEFYRLVLTNAPGNL